MTMQKKIKAYNGNILCAVTVGWRGDDLLGKAGITNHIVGVIGEVYGNSTKDRRRAARVGWAEWDWGETPQPHS